MEIKVRKNSTKVVQIDGDVNWDVYGGTFLRIQNKDTVFYRQVVHIPERVEGETKFTVYVVPLFGNVKTYFDWVDWDEVYNFADLHSAQDLQDYDLLIAAASYYGWHNFDSDAEEYTKTELRKYWKII